MACTDLPLQPVCMWLGHPQLQPLLLPLNHPAICHYDNQPLLPPDGTAARLLSHTAGPTLLMTCNAPLLLPVTSGWTTYGCHHFCYICRDKDPDGDRWPGNIPWNTLYPGNGSSARPNRLGNATMTARPPVVPDDPAETGAPPSHDHLDDTSESSETESEQEDYVPEYNPFLVKIIK